ncbi:hypothetical protein IFR05_002867 [Cadophora sp. M221]|nr:hypothetical protein IFR05_002867 [Cadophora sp. M221]
MESLDDNESYQDAAIRKEYESFKAELSKSYSAVKDAYTVPSPGQPDHIPPMLAQLFEELNDPTRLHRMATFGAERQYLEGVHERYFKDEAATSNVEHVAAIASRLADRKQLCDVCMKVAKKISNILVLFNSGIDWELYLDGYWPPRPLPRDGNRDQYIVGNRFIPPECIRPGSMLPTNVMQHHLKAENLVKSAETCPLCELLRVAYVMDSFRERGEEEAFDHSREPLAEIFAGIRRGKGSDLFQKISRQLSQSQDPVYLMLWNESSQEKSPSTGGFKLSYIRLLWERPKTEVTPKERKTVFTRLQVFHSRGMFPPSRN